METNPIISGREIVKAYSDLVIEQPVWSGRVHMVEYNNAVKLYGKALKYLTKEGMGKDIYKSFVGVLNMIAKYPDRFTKNEFEKQSLRMDELLERMVGEIAVYTVLLEG